MPLSQEVRDIVGKPNANHGIGLRILAWAALKSARGQTFYQHRVKATVADKGAGT